MEKNEIERIYGSKVVALVEVCEKFKEDGESYCFLAFSEEILTIYMGDQDVKNVFIAFKEDPTEIRVFSTEEPTHKIQNVDQLISNLNGE